MARRDVKLLGSLIDYVLDIKPYHTKLRDFASEIRFNDSVNVNLTETVLHHIHLQNVWGRDDLGGYKLSTIAEGIDSDRRFRIPAAIWPHFSTNDSLNFNQTPLGDDPAVIDLTDSNNDGIPDSYDPYVGSPNSSHFPTEDWIPVQGIIERTSINVTEVLSNSAIYYYLYDLTVYVNPDLESYYALGNDFQIFVNGNDLTSICDRVSAGSAYDDDNYEGLPYDTNAIAFVIRGLFGHYQLTEEDVASLPGIQNKFPQTIAEFGFAKSPPSIEIQYTNTGRYHVPFHQGSRVYVDGELQKFGTDYVVESSREFIQFLPGRKPAPGATITTNLMKSDKLFISITPPFDYAGVLSGYDVGNYDEYPYDLVNEFVPAISGAYDDRPYDEMPYEDGIPNVATDYFLIEVNFSHEGRHAPVTFFNSTGVDGKGTLNVLNVYDTATDGDIYLIAAVGPWLFTVQKIFPTLETKVTYASFKEIYDDGQISFQIDRTWTPYYMVPDNNTYMSHTEAFNLYPFINNDPTDYLVNLDLKTEHGVVTDPSGDGRHFPIELQSIGKIVKKRDQALTDSLTAIVDSNGATIYPNFEGDYYEFELNEIPIRGTYYEIRVEQNNGFNPTVRATIFDRVQINVFETDSDEVIEINSYTTHSTNEPSSLPDLPPETINDEFNQYVEPDYVDDDYVEQDLPAVYTTEDTYTQLFLTRLETLLQQMANPDYF